MALQPGEEEILNATSKEFAESGFDIDPNPVGLTYNNVFYEPADIARAIELNIKENGLNGERLQRARDFLDRLSSHPDPRSVIAELPSHTDRRIKRPDPRPRGVITYLVFPQELGDDQA